MRSAIPHTIKIFGSGLSNSLLATNLVSLLARKYGLKPNSYRKNGTFLLDTQGKESEVPRFLSELRTYSPLISEFKLNFGKNKINISRINKKIQDFQLVLPERTIENPREIIPSIAELLKKGKLVAIKGKGGFCIVANAIDEQSVNRLRRLKRRGGKPFEVMFKDMETVREYAEVSPKAEELLTNRDRPTVLLEAKKQLAGGVVNGLKYLGVKLPFMEVFNDIFEESGLSSLVFSSGNFPNEPIIKDNDEAISRLSMLCDAILMHDKIIKIRLDESCVFIASNKPRLARRARGFAPYQLKLNYTTEGIVAVGGEIFNTLAAGKKNKVIISQQIGDLRNKPTLDFYKETYHRLCAAYMIRPQLFVHDMNPAYLSTQYAKKLSSNCIPVQHHHAHIASCMAENNLDELVIGICYDGAGFGTDNNIWGGEFFVCDLANFERKNHFEYMPLLGGVKATEEPWRMGLAYLIKVFGHDFLNLDISFLKGIRKEEINLMLATFSQSMSAPFTSSAGRLFDAVAAIINLSKYKTFHAEAPLRLESVADTSVKESYPFEISVTRVLKFSQTIQEIVEDLKKGVSPSIISSKFHRTIVEATVKVAKIIRDETSLEKVVLSGGVFQNKLLLEWMEEALNNEKFDVYSHSEVPFNDAGLALGQLAIASKRMEEIRKKNEASYNELLKITEV